MDAKKTLSLLVPLDGSTMAESVLPFLALLAQQLELKVLLLHALERNAPSSIHGERHLAQGTEATLYLQEIATRVEAMGIEVAIHVHENKVGDVALSILEHAAELAVEMIVLCAHGSGGVRDVLFGTIAEQVLHRGGWPVLLVPPHAAPTTLRQLLLPIDLQHSCEQALAFTARLGMVGETAVLLALVVPTPDNLKGERSLFRRFLPRATRLFLDYAEDDAHTFLRELSARDALRGFTVTTQVLRGAPGPTVLKLAADVGANLIILTSHGRAGLSTFLSPSVAGELTDSLATPLLLLKTAT